MELVRVQPGAGPADRDTILSVTAQERLDRSIPPNTKAAYAYQGRRFLDWCSASGRSALPATPQTLADYVSHLADLDLAPATIEQAIAAIRAAHRQAGYRGQPNTEGALRILQVHQRDRAGAGKRKRKAPPVTLDALRALVDVTNPETLIGLRDRAMLVLGFAAMARRSELAGLQISDVSFSEEDGLTVLIRWSKTDQAASGASVYIPRGVHPDTDPVRVVRAWLDALAEHGITQGPLLRRINRWGTPSGGMAGAAINDRIRLLATRAGLADAALFTAHGLRAGGPTEAAKAGHPIAFIAEHGRWSKNSTQVMEYIRPVEKWRDNPMRGIGL